MRASVRVVINCAGEGRRLGLGSTKALVSVMGEPLIAWHLRMLRHVDDVVVVVGYQAEQVIEVVRPLRPDAIFAFNHDYATTGTAASLAKGCRGAIGDVISLDGDLLVHPEDFEAFLRAPRPCLGVAPATTTHAVHARVVGENGSTAVVGFNEVGDGLEWTGLLRVPGALVQEAEAGHATRGHVFEMLAEHLPMQALHVRAREIDTPADYDRALEWLAPIAHHWS